MAWRAVTGRGFTPAERWIVRFQDGSSAFAKVATERLTVNWIRLEHLVYTHLEGPFLPGFIGWDDDDERPLLLLEDLSRGRWPPPWPQDGVHLVLQALEVVHGSPPLDWLPTLESRRTALSGWARVAEDPDPFLSLGLASQEWLRRSLPALLDAEGAAQLGGEALVHFDVRSDNICLSQDRALLVDWNWACRGNSEFDLAAWLPSLEREGGPPPERLLPKRPSLAALISGFFASLAGLPAPEGWPSVRQVQLEQLRSALPWACREVEVPAPDGQAGRRRRGGSS